MDAGEDIPFRIAANCFRDAVFLIDLQGDVVWANRVAGEAVARSPEALRGRPFVQILTPSSAEAAEQVLQLLGGGGDGPTLRELDFIRSDLTASRLEVEFNVLPPEFQTIAAVGRSLGARGLLTEERRRAEFQTLQFQAALVELARSESRSLYKSFAHLTGVAAATLDVAHVGIWLYNGDRTQIHCVHLFDREHNQHQIGAIIDVGRYPRYFEALEESRTIAVEDALRDPLTEKLASDYLVSRSTTSVLDVAIRREGKTVGVLCHEHTGRPRQWRLDERNFAASVADLAALALEADSRRQVEGDLHKSLDQLELFFSQSLDGFFFMMLDEPIRWDGTAADKARLLEYIFDHQRMVKVNNAMLSQYGTPREQLIGITPRGLFSHDVDHGKDLWRRMLDAGRLHVESDERRADGTRMWVEGDYICFYDAAGRITGHFGIQRDITERKRAEETLRLYNRRLTLLQHIDRAILSARSVEEIAAAVLAHVHELAPCKRASVLEFDLTAGAARVVKVHPPVNSALTADSVVPLDIFGNLSDLRGGKPHIAAEIDNTLGATTSRNPLEEGIRCSVNVPLVAEGELIGALNLGSDQNAAFSPDHVEIAREVANSLAVALRHARLTDKIARHASELEQRVAARTAELSKVNASLKESEERLASVFHSAMDAIIVINSRREVVIFNEAAEKVFRCGSAQVTSRSIDVFLADDFLRLLQSYIANGGTGPLWVLEGVRAVRMNGDRFPIEATVSRSETSGGTLFTIILRDINERKKAEERLEQLSRQNTYLRQEIEHELNFEEIVGASVAIQRVFNNIEMVAGTDSTVLLLGETGTGKELIARAVHNRSRRRQSAMIKVNCGALPSNLVESELFGHERGAFTGAVSQKKGRFELANRGTIFLDEVGELPLDTQSKLLRVLQEQEFERVGGSQTLKVDVRVIAATNRDLRDEVKRGTFRTDLYYRLNVFPIEVPPLRHRREDIPLLAAYFVRKFSERMGKRIQGISQEAAGRMQRYDWPGNVRELANLMERAVIFCQGSTLDDSQIALAGPPGTAAVESTGSIPTLEEAERQLILEALEKTNGVLAGPGGAAQLLGINRSTLWSRMRKLGIATPKSKGAASD